ncbi:MAG: threonine ammonia-lyase [Planctomycetota bacterium]|nr:MAG: threonine ammonia-lyase [Planctomycetota bacterium]
MKVCTYADVVAAQDRIRGHVYRSPCVPSDILSRLCGAQVWSKLDHLQATGSFKERGARNRLASLSAEERQRGVIAVSAGNHALGLARHGSELGIAVQVVMPHYAPMVKVARCRELGAEVILHRSDFSAAQAHAHTVAKSSGAVFIPAFDHPQIIAGQGTIGLEILADVPHCAAIFVPVGGGGLAAGLALAVKQQRPDCKIIGVEPEHAASMYHALRHGGPCSVPTAPTLADGLAVAQVGRHCFDICQQLLDDVVLVDESSIAQAIVRLLEHEKTLLEGAGAAALAGALSANVLKRHDLLGKTIVLVLCGGNIDVNILNRVVQRGLAADGRICRVVCSLKDRPGVMAQLLAIIADAEGNVQEINHDRTFGPRDPALVTASLSIETRDHQHITAIHHALTAADIDWREG